MCIKCGTHTREFEQPRTNRWPAEGGDQEANDDALNLVETQAVEAWNGGKFVTMVEDIKLDVFALGVLGEMIQNYLERQETLTPAERVKGWDALKRKWQECGRLVRKEVEDGA